MLPVLSSRGVRGNSEIGRAVHMTDLQSFGENIVHNLEQVIVGKTQSVELVVIGLLCQGHILIEDVPGVGKTMLARSLAKSLDCTFNRIQFTPDMLPSDVTGVSIFNQETHKFPFSSPGKAAAGSFPQRELSARILKESPISIL